MTVAHTHTKQLELVTRSDGVVLRVGQGSGPRKQDAKNAAADEGYLWLRAQYPEVDI